MDKPVWKWESCKNHSSDDSINIMKILLTSIIDIEKSVHNRPHDLLKHLQIKHDVTVLCINDWWKAKHADSTVNINTHRKVLNNVTIRHLTKRRLSPIIQEIMSSLMIDSIINELNYRDFDVHLNYNGLITGYLVARKLRAVGVNTVYDIADDLPEMVYTSKQILPFLRPIAGLFSEIIFKNNINIASQVTTTMTSLATSLKIPQSKTKIIPNGVDTELFRFKPCEILKRKLNFHESFIVGYVGVLREWVDFKPVFSAISQLNDEGLNIKILIVGEEGGLVKAKQLAQKLKIENQIIFTGTVPYDEVPKYISCMDLCILPFLNNAVTNSALPLKLFEYMACERPIISSPLKGVKAIVGEKVIYASNSESFKAAIKRIYENDDLSNKLGAAGRAFVKKHFSWNQICLDIEEILIHEANKKEHEIRN